MKILVTGCYGFVGSHVVRRLLALGHTVVGADRLVEPKSPKQQRVEALAGAGMKFVEAALGSQTRAREIVQGANFDRIVHLAAQFPVKHDSAGVASYLDSNVRAYLNVMEVARLAKVPRVIYASTVAVSDAGRPGSLYGATKIFNEHAAYVYSKFGIEMVGLRYGAVYGPMMRKDAGIFRTLQGALAGRAINSGVYAAKRPVVAIADAVEVTVRFVEAPSVPAHGVYLVAADDWYPDYGDFVTMAAEQCGWPAVYPAGYTVRERTERPDLARLAETIGWLPQTSLFGGIKPLCAWVREECGRTA